MKIVLPNKDLCEDRISFYACLGSFEELSDALAHPIGPNVVIPLHQYESAFFEMFKYNRWGLLEKFPQSHGKPPSELMKEYIKINIRNVDLMKHVSKYVDLSEDILSIIQDHSKSDWEHIVEEILPQLNCDPMFNVCTEDVILFFEKLTRKDIASSRDKKRKCKDCRKVRDGQTVRRKIRRVCRETLQRLPTRIAQSSDRSV